jgi:hypothetical protein
VRARKRSVERKKIAAKDGKLRLDFLEKFRALDHEPSALVGIRQTGCQAPAAFELSDF